MKATYRSGEGGGEACIGDPGSKLRLGRKKEQEKVR